MTLLEQATPAEAPETRLPSVLEPMAADLARLEAFLRDHAKDLYQTGKDVRTGAGSPILPTA